MGPLLDLLAGRSDELELDRAALLLARLEYPALAIEPFPAILNSYAVELAGRLHGDSHGADYVACANQYLFGELGFAGNSGNYYDLRNSCLNDVLTAHTGIPITLALVYMEIARRLAKPVHGGRRLTRDQCFELAGQMIGADVPPDPGWLAPVDKRQIVLRMLNNLYADPGAAEEYKQRGLLHLHRRSLRAARGDLESYLRLAPAAADRAAIEEQLRAVQRSLAGLN